MSGAAELLAELAVATDADAPLERLDFGPDARSIGFRIRTLATHHVDVVEQLFNWRVVAVPLGDPNTVDEAYCYLGKDLGSFMRAVLGAAVWGGPGHGPPAGYDKDAVTGRWADGREGPPSAGGASP